MDFITAAPREHFLQSGTREKDRVRLVLLDDLYTFFCVDFAFFRVNISNTHHKIGVSKFLVTSKYFTASDKEQHR
jgi:hypothetical protein